MSYEFDHVAQQVPDIAAAVTWYLELLPGAQVLYQDDSWAFMEANGTKLAFVKRDQHPQHLAWRVSDAELERLANKWGKEIAVHRDKTRSFYLEAPGGQWVEIICWEPREDEDLGNRNSTE
jgi:hypothetical protein